MKAFLLYFLLYFKILVQYGERKCNILPILYIREVKHDVYGRRQTANGKDYL